MNQSENKIKRFFREFWQYKDLLKLLVTNPRERFGIKLGNDFTVWDLEAEYTVDPETFATMGRATPFAGNTVQGKCMLTVCGGKVAYADEDMTRRYGIKEGDIL